MADLNPQQFRDRQSTYVQPRLVHSPEYTAYKQARAENPLLAKDEDDG